MAALPIAMFGATVLAGVAGWASLATADSERDSIQLQSGQHVRIQSRVRLSEEGKKKYPDSCLVASGDGTVTKVDVAGRKATVRCNKNRRAAPEEIPADDLEVIDSGINAPGISIPGGYLTEGASVRMLDSSKRTNRGKALASPFYNPVGTVMVIDKVQKQVVVLSNHLNNKSTAQEFYNVDDLEFVSGPSADARKGAEAGLAMKIGSTVELTDEAKKKYTPSMIESNLGTKSDNKKLADPKWEKFGIVKSITVDPKDIKKKIVIVRSVSKDSKKEVLEQKYDFTDLKAIPAISVERAGIAVFGGMAEMDTKVKLRSERKSAVASKSLGRSAFGDVGTVSDLEPNDPNNLKVFVTCNGINPEEQTGDWYQPEDLELAEPEDTQGEAVFGGRVVVGSTVRVMQSARGKKCLGTPEFGDVGTVKGIDPSAADNLKINVTCGRTDAKQSEWYDPRDLSLYFPVDESGSELEKAKVALAAAQKELSAWQLRPQDERRSDQGRTDRKVLEDKVAAAQAEVDRLSGQGLDKTKANEMRNDSEERLDEAIKLKRELEAVRLKLSRDSTCKKPDRSTKYKENTDKVVGKWLSEMTIDKSDYSGLGLEPLQYSNSYRVALTELQTAFNALRLRDDDTYTSYKNLNSAKLALKNRLKSNRSDPESFSNLDDILLEIAKEQAIFDKIEPNPYKSALKTVDEKLKKLQEVTTQIQSAAYSGDSPAEKLLKRVEELEKKTSDDINGNDTDLQKATREYNNAFAGEQANKHILERVKYDYDQKFLAATGRGKTGQTKPTEDELGKLFDKVEDARREYIKSQTDTLKKRKARALLSAKTTCSEITLESVKDMKEKIQKIINGKCGVLTTIDELLDQVDDLISKRRRAFTMSQAVLDPKFGDPSNATFNIPITSPEDRIAEIQTAMAAIKSLEPSDGGEMKKLQRLIDLCGTYTGDTLLPEAKAIKQHRPAPPNNCPPNPGTAPAAPGEKRPEKPVRLNPDAAQVVPPPPVTPPGTPEESEDDEPPPSPAPAPAPAPPASNQQARLEWVAQHSAGAAQRSGFAIGQTPGNGNCLFGAVASALAGRDLPDAEREQQEDELRAAAVAYIADPQNIETFRGIEAAIGGITGYVERMTQDKTFGGDPEIAALEAVSGRCINVWQPRTGGTDLEKYKRGQVNTTGCLNLFYNGINHYDPLYGSGPTSGGKRKWPFYGRRTTRRSQRGGVEKSQVDKAKADYDAATEKLTKYEAAVNAAKAKLRSGNINPNDPSEKKMVELVRDTNTVRNVLLQYRGEQASAYATYIDLKTRQEEQQNQSEANDSVATPAPAPEADEVNPFRPPPPPPPAPLTQSQRFDNLVAQDEVLPNMADVPEVNPFAAAPAPGPAPAPVPSQSQRFRDLAAGPQPRRAVNAPEQDVPEVNPFTSVPSGTVNVNPFASTKQTPSQRFQDLATRRKPFSPANKSQSQRFKDLVEKDRKTVKEATEKAAKKAKDAAEAAATKAYNKNLKAYNSLIPKWEEYDNKYKAWRSARDLFDKCYTKYVADKQAWIGEYNDWSDKLIKVAETLSTDQILRLQSRGVGSSLMLDEARKLMIDADAQQRTVMDLKTDLQFTLASSSDADIAKAVGFYEAELQKLKTCISKGKEDAIAEYDKDLAEIEKKKKEITAKTFEVKAPQENQQQGKKNYSNVKDSELPTRLQEARKSFNDANVKLRANPNDKNAQDQKKGAEGRIAGITAEFVKRNIPVPTPGGRRMTMRRRRV